MYHNYDTSYIKLVALEVIRENYRVGVWDQWILRQETKWIYTLTVTKSPGLNQMLSINNFWANTIRDRCLVFHLCLSRMLLFGIYLISLFFIFFISLIFGFVSSRSGIYW